MQRHVFLKIPTRSSALISLPSWLSQSGILFLETMSHKACMILLWVRCNCSSWTHSRQIFSTQNGENRIFFSEISPLAGELSNQRKEQLCPKAISLPIDSNASTMPLDSPGEEGPDSDDSQVKTRIAPPNESILPQPLSESEHPTRRRRNYDCSRNTWEHSSTATERSQIIVKRPSHLDNFLSD